MRVIRPRNTGSDMLVIRGLSGEQESSSESGWRCWLTGCGAIKTGSVIECPHLVKTQFGPEYRAVLRKLPKARLRRHFANTSALTLTRPQTQMMGHNPLRDFNLCYIRQVTENPTFQGFIERVASDCRLKA